jgi:hypothetical protein
VKRYLSPKVALHLVKQPGWEKVTYYPGTQDFFQPGSRKRFLGADRVVLAKGEFFAYKPRFHESTAPVSAIERKLGLAASAEEFYNACHDPASGKFCQAIVHQRTSRGVMGKGTESFTTKPKECGKEAIENGMCATHLKQLERMKAAKEALVRRKGVTSMGSNAGNNPERDAYHDTMKWKAVPGNTFSDRKVHRADDPNYEIHSTKGMLGTSFHTKFKGETFSSQTNMHAAKAAVEMHKAGHWSEKGLRFWNVPPKKSKK